MSTNQVMARGTVKYSTQLPPQQIKWTKREALDADLKDYEVVSAALDVLRLALDEDMQLPTDLLPVEAARILDTLKAGKQETLVT
ncbi:hypothetical protein JHN55_25225 [Streptomyces sp. MBT56]|uniref:hypothetical protein n=1 Tax=unclassified Streptomyces TaxID=2593676 RepID=UPI00190C67C0|nr:MULTISPECIES: hypothetical protein [unclassified Streptomyces]MBK3559767.1 hypothetical protein [Streptomyces sp. MBT56]MBK3601291.1 hypothetical protein [Streptomyces sp. MBT54]MBK3615262.1 hypothetical protein [Streptomyces sp. MBT98]